MESDRGPESNSKPGPTQPSNPGAVDHSHFMGHFAIPSHSVFAGVEAGSSDFYSLAVAYGMPMDPEQTLFVEPASTGTPDSCRRRCESCPPRLARGSTDAVESEPGQRMSTSTEAEVLGAWEEALVSCAASAAAFAPSPSLFNSFHTPAVGIRDYAQRLQYLHCTAECFIVSLVLLERLLEHNKNFAITDLNVRRLFFTALVLAAKLQDDDLYSDHYYARVGVVTSDEMDGMEGEFLKMIDWKAYVSVDDYELCLKRLCDGSLSLHRGSDEIASPLLAGHGADVSDLPVAS